MVFITVGELNEMNRRLRRLERMILGKYLGPIVPKERRSSEAVADPARGGQAL